MYNIKVTMIATEVVNVQLNEQEYKEFCKYGYLPEQAESDIDMTLTDLCVGDLEWECKNIQVDE